MIKYLILDIDGTFTDGGIYYDSTGNEIKKFCAKDGVGIICARMAGIKIVVLTGRESVATIRRMKELMIYEIHQNVKDKGRDLKSWIKEHKVERAEVGYIGDDINDLGAMKLCGYIGCPADAAAEVKEIADYVSTFKGGHGAVRDVIERILRDEGLWHEIINKTYGA